MPFNGQEAATAKWLAASVLLDYKFLDASYAVRPYVGVGFNSTRFYKLECASTAATARTPPA